MPKPALHLAKRAARWLAATAVALAVLAAGLVLVGDFGLTQRWLNGVERRALAGHATRADRWGLQLLYGALQLGGRAAYPQAAGLLAHYCAGSGDTLRFDARPLLQHPEVRRALALRRPGITFRHQPAAGAGPFYVARRTDWGLYYAFDLLYIRREAGAVTFYDNYFFQPVRRRSYTRLQLGRLRVRLNDGLIRVAYPRAKPFVVYGRVAVPPALALAR